MKQSLHKFLGILGALALAVSASTAFGDVITITEDASTETLSVTLNGNPFPAVITGTQDNWTIQLPSGYYFQAEPGDAIPFVEPEDSTTLNILTITQPGSGVTQLAFATLQSDLPFSQAPPPLQVPAPTTVTIPGYIEHEVTGQPPEVLTLTLQDIPLTNRASDGSSTAGLLLLASCALFGASRFGLLRGRLST
jgi:hypothetical protein